MGAGKRLRRGGRARDKTGEAGDVNAKVLAKRVQTETYIGYEYLHRCAFLIVLQHDSVSITEAP